MAARLETWLTRMSRHDMQVECSGQLWEAYMQRLATIGFFEVCALLH